MWWVPDFAIDKYRDTLVQLRHPDARRRPPRRSLGPTPDRSTTTRGPVSHLSEQAQVLAAGSVVCSLPRIRRPTSETGTGTRRPVSAPTGAALGCGHASFKEPGHTRIGRADLTQRRRKHATRCKTDLDEHPLIDTQGLVGSLSSLALLT